MGGGCGPVPNDVELSVARAYLEATKLTCPDGKQVALFGGGNSSGVPRNDVDVFECCDTTNEVQLLDTVYLSERRYNLAATTLTCPNGKQVALFGGGNNAGGSTKNDVDVFECCDTTCDVQLLDTVYLSKPRSNLAATTLTCPNGKQVALFGGGLGNDNTYSNDVDVFECCDTTCDVQLLDTVYLSKPRAYLAATTLTCADNKQVALFGGGGDAFDVRNDVDVFACCDETCDVQLLDTVYLSKPRYGLAATTLTCPNGKQFALFGGGLDDNNFRNDVDVFECCDDNGSIEYKKTIYLSEPRGNLAATTINDCCNREVALFGGGRDNNTTYYNVVDIFDCEDIMG
jgi:hypothetical protein